jgi:cell division septal protein FtsQ
LAVTAALLFAMRSLPGFEVSRVIMPETRYLAAADITAALAGTAGQNIFAVSTEELERRLSEFSYVQSVQVYRRFPDALEVRLQEREPFARLRGRERTWLVAEDGVVLAPAADGFPDLVLFRLTGPPPLKAGEPLPDELRGLLPLAQKLGSPESWPAGPPVSAVKVSPKGEAVLILEGGAEVRLGPVSQLDDKFMVAQEIIKEYSSQGRALAYVDVYVPERPVAKEKSP